MELVDWQRRGEARRAGERAGWGGPRAKSWQNLCIALLLCGCLGCPTPDPIVEIRERVAAGEGASTLEPLRKLMAERPDDPEVNFYYGRALIASGQPSLAEWSLRKAMTDPEWRTASAMQLATTALVSESYPAALEAIEIVLESDPDNLPALLMRGNARAHSRTDFEGAIGDADRLFELDPDFIDAYEPKVLALLGLERYEEAGETIEALGEAMKKADLQDDRYAWHCATLAIYANDSQEFDLAVERWEGCLEQYPGDPGVVWPAIKFFDGRAEFPRSLEITRRANEAVPEDQSFQSALAARLRHAGEMAEAEALLKKSSESEDPATSIAALLELVIHYRELNDYENAVVAAEGAYAAAGELGEPSPQLQLELADTLLMAGQFDRALEIADEMESGGFREMIRARVAQSQDDPAKALEHFDAAFLLWPNNPWARYMAAAAAEDVGDFERAVEEYRYSIRIDPGATRARTDVALLMLAQGRATEALQLIRIGAADAPLDLEGEFVSLRAYGATRDLARIRQTLTALASNQPASVGGGLAAAAEGMISIGAFDSALPLFKQTAGFQPTVPFHADGLRAWVDVAARSKGEALGEVLVVVNKAVAAHPTTSAFYEIRAEARARSGAPDSEVRNDYARAVELDPNNARALTGLARTLAKSDPAEAMTLLERAVAADPEWPRARIELATLMIERGRVAEAEPLLLELLDTAAYEAEPPLLLAELRLGRGDAGAETIGLIERSVSFGGGGEATALLERARAASGAPQAPEKI